DDRTAASVAVVPLQGLVHLAERDTIAFEPVRIGLHLVSLELSAERVDLDHAGDAAELISDLPVEDGSKFHRRELEARGGADFELVDLAHAGRDRTKLRVAGPGWDRLASRLQPLSDQLSRPVDVDSLLEHDRDRR